MQSEIHSHRSMYPDRADEQQKSMIRRQEGTMKEKNELINVFNSLIRLEKDLERKKIEITLKDDYNLIDAFGLLDV